MQGISKEAETALIQYSWRGNVRELENVIERAIVLAAGPVIMLEDLPLDVLEGLTPPTALPFFQAVDAFKREIIEQALRENSRRRSSRRCPIGSLTNTNIHVD